MGARKYACEQQWPRTFFSSGWIFRPGAGGCSLLRGRNVPQRSPGSSGVVTGSRPTVFRPTKTHCGQGRRIGQGRGLLALFHLHFQRKRKRRDPSLFNRGICVWTRTHPAWSELGHRGNGSEHRWRDLLWLPLFSTQGGGRGIFHHGIAKTWRGIHASGSCQQGIQTP